MDEIEAMSESACLDPDGVRRCLASGIFEQLGRKYAMDVLCVVASHDAVRFSTIEESVPAASTSTLSTRLDDLAAEGLVERERYDEIPPRVEYRLSDDGAELAERMAPLVSWLAERDERSDAE